MPTFQEILTKLREIKEHYLVSAFVNDNDCYLDDDEAVALRSEAQAHWETLYAKSQKDY